MGLCAPYMCGRPKKRCSAIRGGRLLPILSPSCLVPGAPAAPPSATASAFRIPACPGLYGSFRPSQSQRTCLRQYSQPRERHHRQRHHEEASDHRGIPASGPPAAPLRPAGALPRTGPRRLRRATSHHPHGGRPPPPPRRHRVTSRRTTATTSSTAPTPKGARRSSGCRARTPPSTTTTSASSPAATTTPSPCCLPRPRSTCTTSTCSTPSPPRGRDMELPACVGGGATGGVPVESPQELLPAFLP